jgi:hypothetical protein
MTMTWPYPPPADAACRLCGAVPAVTKDRLCQPCRNAYMRSWTDRNRERVRAYNRGVHRKLREEVIAHYGGTCACCGEARYEFLALDHINGGGAADRKQASAAHKHLWRWVKHRGLPDGFRVLCHNCNMALGFFGYCPHQETTTQ